MGFSLHGASHHDNVPVFSNSGRKGGPSAAWSAPVSNPSGFTWEERGSEGNRWLAVVERERRGRFVSGAAGVDY